MKRFEEWPLALARYIESVRQRPFAWGRHDCALMAADAIAAMTGVDLAADLRGSYDSAESAAVVMRSRYGVDDVASVAGRLFGDPITPRLAQRGDLLLLDGEHGPALGICLGTHAAAPGARGMVLMPMEQWLKAWRV